MVKKSRVLFVLLVAFVVVGSANLVMASEAWESIQGEEFTFVVGFAAGGSNDLGARILAQQLEEYGINVRVVNRPGSMGVEAAGWVASQRPDSNIFFWGVPLTLFFEPATRDVGYTWEDFEPVASLGGATFGLAVRDDAPWDTLDDIIDYARDNPGSLIVGGQGELGQMHFSMASLFDTAGVDYIYVPFAGGADVQMNLAGGHCDVGHLSIAASYPLYSAGELKIPVHTSILTERLDMMPDVPNIAEVGFPEAQELHLLFLWGPKGTSSDVIQPLAAAIETATQDPDFVQRLGDLGILVSYLGPEEMRDLARDSHETLIPAFVEWYENY